MVGESASEATRLERTGGAKKLHNYQKKLRVCQVFANLFPPLGGRFALKI